MEKNLISILILLGVIILFINPNLDWSKDGIFLWYNWFGTRKVLIIKQNEL